MTTEINYTNHGPSSLNTMPYVRTLPRSFEIGDLEQSLDSPNVNIEVHAALVPEFQRSITDAPFGFLSGKLGPKMFSNGNSNLAYVVLAQTSSKRRFGLLQEILGDKITTVAAGGEVVTRDPLQGIRGPKDYMAFLLGIVQEVLEKGRNVSIHSYEPTKEQETHPYLSRALETLASENDNLCLIPNPSNP
jgi:hypothetical protein